MHWLVPVCRAVTPPTDAWEAQRGAPQHRFLPRQSADWPNREDASALRTLTLHKPFYLAFSPAELLFHWLSLQVAHDHLRHDPLRVNLNRNLVPPR
jgi:hypothetical protein